RDQLGDLVDLGLAIDRPRDRDDRFGDLADGRIRHESNIARRRETSMVRRTSHAARCRAVLERHTMRRWLMAGAALAVVATLVVLLIVKRSSPPDPLISNF